MKKKNCNINFESLCIIHVYYDSTIVFKNNYVLIIYTYMTQHITIYNSNNNIRIIGVYSFDTFTTEIISTSTLQCKYCI